MAICNVIPPPWRTETDTIHSDNNARVTAYKCGNVVTINVFNVKPSVLASNSCVIPTRMRAGRRIDVAIGWVWDRNNTRPAFCQIVDGNFTGLGAYDPTTDNVVSLTDAYGTVFGTVTYVIP